MSEPIRFLHEHPRDFAEIEALATFVCSRAVAVPPLAVRVMAPAEHDYPSGWAHLSSWPKWALRLYPRRSQLRRRMYAISVRTITDTAAVLGEPHICWHATQARDAGYNAVETKEGGLRWERDSIYQRPAWEAWERGERTLGRWPIYVVNDWREAFIHIFAHELSHVLQYQRSGRNSEVQCERFAARVLDAYRG